MKKISMGFTEIVVVVLVIGAIAYAILCARKNGIEKKHDGQCMSNQRQIALATMFYAQEHEGKMPVESNFWSTMNVSATTFHCAADDKSSRVSYVVNNQLLGMKLTEIAGASTLLSADGQGSKGNIPMGMLYSTADLQFRHHEGIIASFCDCHVEYITKTRFVEESKSGKIRFTPKCHPK